MFAGSHQVPLREKTVSTHFPCQTLAESERRYSQSNPYHRAHGSPGDRRFPRSCLIVRVGKRKTRYQLEIQPHHLPALVGQPDPRWFSLKYPTSGNTHQVLFDRSVFLRMRLRGQQVEVQCSFLGDAFAGSATSRFSAPLLLCRM